MHELHVRLEYPQTCSAVLNVYGHVPKAHNFGTFSFMSETSNVFCSEVVLLGQNLSQEDIVFQEQLCECMKYKEYHYEICPFIESKNVGENPEGMPIGKIFFFSIIAEVWNYFMEIQQ